MGDKDSLKEWIFLHLLVVSALVGFGVWLYCEDSLLQSDVFALGFMIAANLMFVVDHVRSLRRRR